MHWSSNVCKHNFVLEKHACWIYTDGSEYKTAHHIPVAGAWAWEQAIGAREPLSSPRYVERRDQFRFYGQIEGSGDELPQRVEKIAFMLATGGGLNPVEGLIARRTRDKME
jgi:hypothetical protein